MKHPTITKKAQDVREGDTIVTNSLAGQVLSVVDEVGCTSSRLVIHLNGYTHSQGYAPTELVHVLKGDNA